MFRIDRRSSLLALIAACAFGTVHADEPAPPQEPPADPPADPNKPADPPADPNKPVDPPKDGDKPSEPPKDAPVDKPADKPADKAVEAASVTIKGSIIDNNTKVGLPAATIQIKSTAGDQTLATELDGTFTFTLVPGTHTIVFSTAEYVEQKRTVTVVANQTVDININLDPVPATSQETIEIVDKIDTRKESAVLAVRRAAATVSDALSSQEIARTPDSNASDAMKRVVAVTVVDGKYVALRGLEGRYVTALLNGVLLPSPEPDRNAIPLDLFPTSLLSTMTVLKSYSAELPGQFGGGTLSIDTSSFPTRFEFKLGVTTSANTQATGQSGLTNAQSNGFRNFLGFDNGRRAFPSEIPKNQPVRNMPIEQTERIGEAMPNVWSAEGETVTPNLGLTATVGNTTKLGDKRVGYLATGMLRRNFNLREGFAGSVSLTDAGVQRADALDYQIGIAEATLGGLVNVGVDLTPNDEISAIGLYTHVGEDISQLASGFNENDGEDVDVSRLSFVERTLAFTQLRGKHLLARSRGVELHWQGNFARAGRNELDTRDLVYLVDNASGTRSYKDQPGSGQHFWQELKDNSGGAGADIRARLGRVSVRAGANAQLSQRALGGRRFRFRYVGTDPMTRQLDPEEMFSAENIGPEFLLEESTLQEDSYTAGLDVFAGFVSSEVQLHEKLRVIGGARFEQAHQEMKNGSRFAVAGLEAEVNRDDSDLLPTANAVYSPRADVNLRAAYSYTLTRPRFRELAPFLFFDYVRRRDISGDPNLVTTHIHNADLRWEWFPSEDEVFAASAFYKRFSDPIELVTTSIGSAPGSTFRNVEAGNVAGAELEARTSLGRIDNALRRFRIGSNLAFIRSRVELDAAQNQILTSKKRPLYGQSPFVVNVSVGYVDPKFADINLLYNVIGPRIADVGIEGLPDTYERPLHRLDLVVAKSFRKDLKLKVSASNLLNQEVRLEQGDFVVNSYKPGVAFSLGLDWTP